MPMVDGKKYPYTPKGMAAAKAAEKSPIKVASSKSYKNSKEPNGTFSCPDGNETNITA
jgi:hypothetical protein